MPENELGLELMRLYRDLKSAEDEPSKDRIRQLIDATLEAARRARPARRFERGVDQLANPVLAGLVLGAFQIAIKPHQLEAELVFRHQARTQGKPSSCPVAF